MSQPFRFVHAGDFHLERPIGGLAEVPHHLVDLCRDGPFLAAERVIELAVAERADFLVLAGDVLHVGRAGPRALDFLLKQFDRLAERGIAVYWAGGLSERASPWPDGLPLPANVHVFPAGQPRHFIHEADGESLAAIVGSGNGTRDGAVAVDKFVRPKGGLFTIAVSQGVIGRLRLAKSPIDCWALGGNHRRRLQRAEKRTAIHPGTPQARSAAQLGRHGAVVVQVDQDGLARPRFVATDVARWRRVRLDVDVAQRHDVQRALSDRALAELARAPGIDLLIDWTIVPTARASLASEREALAADLLRWLREEFGRRSPAVWSATLSIDAPRAAQPVDDGTLLADYLAAIRAFAAADATLPLAGFVPEPHRRDPVAELLAVGDGRGQTRILDRVAALGRNLLRAAEVPE
ncbi:MAG: metallophosphoesterase [Planctomycetia bacterium]|nr:metallophosphoesterase [Planctomycetia bacterium]